MGYGPEQRGALDGNTYQIDATPAAAKSAARAMYPWMLSEQGAVKAPGTPSSRTLPGWPSTVMVALSAVCSLRRVLAFSGDPILGVCLPRLMCMIFLPTPLPTREMVG